MARNALVLPAPFGPTRPTMRPGSIDSWALSRATCEPYRLVKFLASISGAMAVSFFFGIAAAGRSCRMGNRRSLREQFVRRESEPVNDGENLRPFLIEETFAFSRQQ